LRLLSELITKGLEVHPALTAPQEQVNSFPDPKRVIEALRALPAARAEEYDSNTESVGEMGKSQENI